MLRLPDLRLHDLGTAVKVKAKSWQKGAKRHFWSVFPVFQVSQVSQISQVFPVSQVFQVSQVITHSQLEPLTDYSLAHLLRLG